MVAGGSQVMAREMLWQYQHMAPIDPAPNPEPKKKTFSAAPKQRPGKERKLATPEKKDAPPGTVAPASVGRMERTRRLLLAALRVWELKRRVRD